MFPKTLIFATNNKHKVQEVQAMLGDTFILKTLDEMGFKDDIEETGGTFEENASIKSRHIYKYFKIDCFADDSGLEVDALNGEPGVYSARYSGTRDDETNLQLVLSKLGDSDNRQANFRSVISLIVNGEEHLFEGVVNGTIRHEKAGAAGFGYDPIFQPDGYAITFAEMSPEQKNTLSHRGKAIEKMVKFLKGERL
ncbi:RdgB/HAM1 family non-canonical purine NTP pyrophosphatase (plasmid) [Pedobacter sp. BS3]|uniref:RdgB/HAM1 family non-canonical purine NTP pyrophosphatase n=1 Tax=Pedobacter sp. BS3 TaxID=2567937 RepID=UPI0011EFEB7E|nr:RdgB/HAM1 family non-canonical purine NTP pyrophosphatase [Pedobacter sp. BS3]TZF85640.1 RdgB/HAM1 family non-canonical purine NTP pyrophosphatase [Pedobacter sp. BS3]